MGNGLIAFLVALGAGTWVYAKTNRSSGGANSKAAVTVAGAVGVIAFIIMITLLLALDDFLAK